jgi:hypothetical protein
MPGKQGVRRHNCGDVLEDASSECLGLHRQTPGAPLLVDPTSERDEHEPQWMGRLSYGHEAIRVMVIGCLVVLLPHSCPYAIVAKDNSSALGQTVATVDFPCRAKSFHT